MLSISLCGDLIAENGGKEVAHDGKLSFQINSETPTNVEPLPQPLDRTEELKRIFLPSIEKDLTGAPIDKARSAYLAI